MEPYKDSAAVYDIVYRYKSYQAEVFMLQGWIGQHARRPVRTLLDVGCGTGAHLRFLRQSYRCEGVELSPEMAAVARERLPDVPIHVGDMRTFRLGRQFDAVTCLFSAIGYMLTGEDLERGVRNMAAHVAPGGLLIVEAWFHPGQFTHGKMHAGVYEDPETETKVARMTRSEVHGDLSLMIMHHLVGTPTGVSHFVETHTMGLFSDERYREAFSAAGLAPFVEADGLIGRSVYLAAVPG